MKYISDKDLLNLKCRVENEEMKRDEKLFIFSPVK